MSEFVRDIMSREVISLRTKDRCDEAARYLGFLGIHAAPVVDDGGRVVGMLSMADLLGDIAHANVTDRMSSPALTVAADASLPQAQEIMTSTGFHHLAVTDADDKPVGFLSALDLLSANTGRPPVHPSTPSLAQCTANDLWSDDAALARDAVEAVPKSPGHFLLVVDDDLVWAESCHDLHNRLVEVLEHPNGRIAMFANGGPLKFRYAVIEGGPHRILAARG